MPDPIAFTHSGRSLESRAEKNETGWEVRVWDGNDKATRRCYLISDETVSDQSHYGMFGDLVVGLMEMAKRDVVDGLVPLIP